MSNTRGYQRFYNFVGVEYQNKQILEIGALHRPTLGRDAQNVSYADFADTETLRELYMSNPAYDVSSFVDVNYVVDSVDYSNALGSRRFDLILASHVAEHVPDLIRWLTQLEAILNPGGAISLLLPDKRYTFDLIRPTTHTMEMLQAYEHKRDRPDIWCVYLELSRHTPLNGLNLHRPPKEVTRLTRTHSEEQARSEAWATMRSGRYRDTHCSILTPASFLQNLWDLALLGLFRYEITNFYDTYADEIDFFITFTKQAEHNLERILESVRHFQASVKTAAMYRVICAAQDVLVQSSMDPEVR